MQQHIYIQTCLTENWKLLRDGLNRRIQMQNRMDLDLDREGLHHTSYRTAPALPYILSYCSKPCDVSRLALATDLLLNGKKRKDNCSATGLLISPLLSQSAGKPEQQRKAWGEEYSRVHWKKRAVVTNMDSRVILYFMSFFFLSPQAPRRWQMVWGTMWRAMCLFYLLFYICIYCEDSFSLERIKRITVFFFNQMPNSDLLHQKPSSLLRSLQSYCLTEFLPLQGYELH